MGYAPASPEFDALAWDQLSALRTRGVVLIQTDTLRADHLPWYGYERNTLPLLSGREGWVVAERHYSSASWTFPATASLLTSLHTRRHRLIDIRTLDTSTAQGNFWQVYLPTQGVSVAWFNGNMSMERTNLLDGWQTLQSNGDEPENGSRLFAEALAWIQALPAESPFLVMIQPMDPHRPWRPASEDQWTWADYSAAPFTLEDSEARQEEVVQQIMTEGTEAQQQALIQLLRDIYDEELLGLDRSTDAFLEGLQSSGLGEQTVVVFTGDHGESLYDVPGAFGHGGDLREELIHVPLAWYHPTLKTRFVDGCLSAHVDILPSIATVLGVPPLEGTDGLPFACRDHVLSERYALEGEEPFLDRVNVETAELRVEVECLTGKVTGFDLLSDPAALDRKLGQELPGGLQVMDTLAEEVRRSLSEYGNITCVWP